MWEGDKAMDWSSSNQGATKLVSTTSSANTFEVKTSISNEIKRLLWPFSQVESKVSEFVTHEIGKEFQQQSIETLLPNLIYIKMATGR